MRRLPLRVRLTLGFTAAMAAALLVIGLVLRDRFAADLLNGVDMDLRSRAQLVVAGIETRSPPVVDSSGALIDPDEAFVQVLDRSGRIVDTSSGVAAGPVLTPQEASSARGAPSFYTSRVRGVDDPVRLLAIRITYGTRPLVVAVGATLGDRNEAVARLTLLMALLSPLALGVVAAAGWLLAGAALRPVERMRREAAAISVSELDRRLDVDPANDEVSRLATTLNEMLARLEEAFRREGALIDQASHELRTPLAVLKAELDLALARARDPEELVRALRNASREADRLVRLAEDLLVLSRMRDGRLPVRRVPTRLDDLVEQIRTAYLGRAGLSGATISSDVEPVTAVVDPSRIRQAIEDLLDNALRYAGPGATITVGARADAATGSAAAGAPTAARIEVRDSGPGFPPAMLNGAAVEPFTAIQADDGGAAGSGLGLSIVRAIAASHGGSVWLHNADGGGAVATITLSG